MATSTKTTRNDDTRVARAVVVGLGALVVVAAIALLSFVGFGFFFIPIVLGVLAVGIFMFALRRIGFRNEMADEDAGLDKRYADGQPLGRSLRRQFHEDRIETERIDKDRFDEDRPDSPPSARPNASALPPDARDVENPLPPER